MKLELLNLWTLAELDDIAGCRSPSEATGGRAVPCAASTSFTLLPAKIRGHDVQRLGNSRKRPCLLHPRKRTCAVQESMSALGQEET